MELKKKLVIKKILKKIIPDFLIQLRQDFILKKDLNKFSKMKVKEVFKKIYLKKLWSPDEVKKTYEFYSGIGSHYEEFTETYINEIKKFLLTFQTKPSVVDLGCGDFSIGSKLRKYCDKYIAADIFDELINSNKDKYKNLDVDFRTLDITKDQLPNGEICFLRQVLQHLSNESIQNFLNLISGKYKYLIITEHLPEGQTFIPNIDIATGPYIRIIKNSGVELTEDPFNLKIINKKNICNIYPKKIKGFKGILNTKILQLYK